MDCAPYVVHYAGLSSSSYWCFFPPCSHLHCPIRLRFLECPPDLRGDPDHADEASSFYADPLGWLEAAFPNRSSLPSHVVLFDPLEKVTDSR